MLKLSDIKECLCIRKEDGRLVIIDALHPNTGRGVYGESSEGETYWGATLFRMGLDEAAEAIDREATTEPEPTTKEQYWEALEVLPPARMERGGFAMGEALTGTVYDHHFYLPNARRRYWHMRASIHTPWPELMAQVINAAKRC